MSNTFKAKIINYQRIRKAEVEFIPGLNIIVGESNNGKSTLGIRAFETAIYNIPREDHITLGETKSAIGIQYNGHEVIWRRDKEAASQVTYRIDGKIYSKLGRGQPKEVSESLGISELEINDKKFRLNFSKQMSYPFLLDATPSDMFKFIAQSSGEDNLVEVLKQMKKDVNEISSNVKSHEESQKVLGESLIQLEKKYSIIKDKRQYCEEIISIDSKVKDYKDLVDSIEVYKRCKIAIEKMNNSLNYYKGIYNDIASSVAVSESKMKILDNIRSLQDGYYSKKHDEIQLSLDKSRYDGVLSRLKYLDTIYNSFKSQESNEIKLLAISSTLSRYKALNVNLTDIINQVSILDGRVERYSKFVDAIGKVLNIKDEKEDQVSYLKETLSRYLGYELDIKSYRVEKEHFEDISDDCQEKISEIGVCPYCGSVLIGGSYEQHRD